MENTNTDTEIRIFINSLRAQISVLEARLKHSHPITTKGTFADAYGLFSSMVQTTEEDVKAVEFKLKDEFYNDIHS
ncbi:MAG: hypothetical protein HQK94_15665 [Nitrospirae bacterium]|nr:hypothetical protein [Nitrospirota bacterium]